MTKKELSQLYYLKKELKYQQRRLEELESLSTSANVSITGLPKSKKIINNVQKYAIEISELKNLINFNIRKCLKEIKKITEYINEIEDSQVRIIVSLKYINGLSWSQVAKNIGGGNSDKSVQMIFNRFLTKK